MILRIPAFIEGLPSSACCLDRPSPACRGKSGVRDLVPGYPGPRDGRVFDLKCSRVDLRYAPCFVLQKAMGRGRVQWNIAHKHHAFWHLAEVLGVVNPRYTSTYSEESMMKTVTRLYSSYAHGPYGRKIQRRVLSRYMTALQVQWSGLV